MRWSILRISLLAGTAVLGVSAVAGGLMLLLGIYSPPVTMLRGSLFTTFTIPGLALLFGVGGSALVASALLLRPGANGFVAAILAGVAVMVFEVVQVISIGSPPGAARIMQATYFLLGLSLTIGAIAGVRGGRTAAR